MELWEKQCAYIPREFMVVEVVEHDHFDHGQGGRARPARSLVLTGSSRPEVLPADCGAR
jgi:hypothetical protein